MSEPTVSICMIAMNRLHHIRETLPVNLEENDFPGVEFILLDYNSHDGLDKYIRDTFADSLETGRLVYYKCKTPTAFDRCHSRNMAFKLASGNIVCNVDADNFAGPGFVKYVQKTFSEKQNICLTGLDNKWMHDASGKLCVTKSDFLEVTGYDENFDGYGYEDYDLANRLTLHGCQTYVINQKPFLRAITHSDIDRLRNERLLHKLKAVYVHYVDPSTSVLLYLFTDATWKSAKVVNNYTLHSNKREYIFVKEVPPGSHFTATDGWQKGTWYITENSLQLAGESMHEICNLSVFNRQEVFESTEHRYYRVTENTMKLDAVSFCTQSENLAILDKNLATKKIRVNESFGNGVVYKNFQENIPFKI